MYRPDALVPLSIMPVPTSLLLTIQKSASTSPKTHKSQFLKLRGLDLVNIYIANHQGVTEMSRPGPDNLCETLELALRKCFLPLLCCLMSQNQYKASSYVPSPSENDLVLLEEHHSVRTLMCFKFTWKADSFCEVFGTFTPMVYCKSSYK